MTAARRLKVLHVIGGVGPGGAETVMYRLVTGSPWIEHEVVCLNSPDWYSAGLAEHGVQVHYLAMTSPGRAWRGLWALRRLLRTSDADLVQGWMYRSNLLAGLFARRGTPVVWGIHNSSLKPLRPVAKLWAYAGGCLAGVLAAHVVNCSARSAELHRRVGFGRAAGSVISNGYDIDQFAPDTERGAQTRRDLEIGPDTFLIGSISRWHYQKDIPNLVRAVRIAADNGVPIKCLLIGHDLGEDNVALRHLIEAERATDLVMPLGRRRDIADLARAMDVHVLASLGEAFPNVVAETMLSGAPNIVTDVGDCAYMVGDTGWVVPPREAESLALAILQAYRQWLDEPQRWADCSAAARSRIVDNFSLERMAQLYTQVWESVANTPG